MPDGRGALRRSNAGRDDRRYDRTMYEKSRYTMTYSGSRRVARSRRPEWAIASLHGATMTPPSFGDSTALCSSPTETMFWPSTHTHTHEE